MLKTYNKGIWYLLGATFCYSIMPLLIRLLDDSSLPPFSQVFLRFVVAFLLSSVVLSRHTRSLASKISIKGIIGLGALSIVGYTGSIILFTYAVLNTSVSTVLFIFYTFPFITPIFDWIVFKKSLNKITVYSLIIASIGLILIFQPKVAGGFEIGMLFAFGAAVAQAYYLVGRRALLSFSTQETMLANTLMGSISAGILAFTKETEVYSSGGLIWSLSWEVWALIVVFGAINFLAWYFLNKGFEHISASTGSVIMLSELVFGVVLAGIFLAEIPTIVTLFGGLCILLANVVVLRADET